MTVQKKKLLQESGLTAYEAAAYLSLLKFGVSEARPIHKDAEVPYGKIYTVLESLAEKGFLEIQTSRPKKYRPVEPDAALDSLFKKRKAEVEKELDLLQTALEEAKQALRPVTAHKSKDDIFWTTAVTETEIKKFVISLYSEAKESVCVIPHSIGMPVLTLVFSEFVNALERGVKVRMLVSSQFINFVSFLSRKDEKTLTILKKNLEFRVSRDVNSHFGVIDDKLVILLHPHPLDKSRLISVVKIWDPELAKNLQKEFELMWNAGKRIEIDTLASDSEN